MRAASVRNRTIARPLMNLRHGSGRETRSTGRLQDILGFPLRAMNAMALGVGARGLNPDNLQSPDRRGGFRQSPLKH